MSNNRIPKKFKTSWGAEYTVYVNDTSKTIKEPEPLLEVNIRSKTDTVKWENVILVLIAIGLFIYGINHKSERSEKKHTSDNYLESNSNSAFIDKEHSGNTIKK